MREGAKRFRGQLKYSTVSFYSRIECACVLRSATDSFEFYGNKYSSDRTVNRMTLGRVAIHFLLDDITFSFRYIVSGNGEV